MRYAVASGDARVLERLSDCESREAVSVGPGGDAAWITLALADIERDYGVSRRTAERMRDAIERVFPQMEQANPGELPKRWRIRAGALSGLIGISAEELAALNTALGLMRRNDLTEPQARFKRCCPSLRR
jgi:hypothetical protein